MNIDAKKFPKWKRTKPKHSKNQCQNWNQTKSNAANVLRNTPRVVITTQREPKGSQKGTKGSQMGAKGIQKGAKGTQKGAKGSQKGSKDQENHQKSCLGAFEVFFFFCSLSFFFKIVKTVMAHL